jgi:hypothetical protein
VLPFDETSDVFQFMAVTCPFRLGQGEKLICHGSQDGTWISSRACKKTSADLGVQHVQMDDDLSGHTTKGLSVGMQLMLDTLKCLSRLNMKWHQQEEPERKGHTPSRYLSLSKLRTEVEKLFCFRLD